VGGRFLVRQTFRLAFALLFLSSVQCDVVVHVVYGSSSLILRKKMKFQARLAIEEQSKRGNFLIRKGDLGGILKKPLKPENAHELKTQHSVFNRVR
jgi:hypothetical protein